MVKASRQEQMDKIIDRDAIANAKQDPVIAKQLLERLYQKLIRDEPLSIEMRHYLAETIRMILMNVPANMAFRLKKKGRKPSMISDENYWIYERVLELREAGILDSDRKIFLKVAEEYKKRMPSGKRTLGEKGIEAIFHAMWTFADANH